MLLSFLTMNLTMAGKIISVNRQKVEAKKMVVIIKFKKYIQIVQCYIHNSYKD